MIREPCVAGGFYPAEKEEIENLVGKLFSNVKEKKYDANAVIAPHAGYIYSGQTAAYSYSALKKVATYIIISPNHTGLGSSISIYPDGKWITPLGEIEIDNSLAAKIAEKLGIERDELAHVGEHSIEVQLPFLQFLYKNKFKLVAITLSEHRLHELKKLGESIFSCSKGKNVALVASSDFCHFVQLQYAKKNDLDAVKKIEALDLEAFHSLVEEKRLSICGFAPIVAVMQYCKKNGLKRGKLLYYDTSATASGDESSVVGYSALKFE